ncbi:MAG: glycosyltransferase [Bacteroidia bacterium]|nr:glycosyltransferase [Bacteroidia bacterium]
MNKKQHNILVITYWQFQDALVQTYTLPYLELISKEISDDSKIFLLTLDKKEVPDSETETNIKNISFPLHSFGLRSMFNWIKIILKLLILIRKEKITTIHAWCTPAGMIGYILSILTGKRLIIDSYEPHAEAMVENGTWKKNSIAFKLLFYFEKKQTRRAAFLIAASEGMKEYAQKKYGHTKNNFFIKPACVDLQLFSEKNIKNKSLLDQLQLHNKITCVYAGKFGGIYLKQDVFDFFKIAHNFWGDRFRVLILSSHTTDEIKDMALKANLDEKVIIHKFVKHQDVPDYMGLGDFAITPVKPVETKKYCTPIKDGEYWALGLPVVITQNISDDSDIIEKNNIGYVLKVLNNSEYAKAVNVLDQLIEHTPKTELYEKIRAIASQRRNFRIAKEIYQIVYH